jgi:membrane-associated phospholipid phosphatase
VVRIVIHEANMRSSAVALAFVVGFAAAPAFAQDPAPQQPAAQQPASQQDPQKPPDKKDQPPAAVGEAGTKPTRGFVKALFYNLGDDMKHMPRQNSIYWLAGGSAAALAIHPVDDDINRHLATSKSANTLFKPGSIVGQGYFILPAAAATYVLGRVDHNGRVQHLGMDEIEAGLLSLGIVEGLKVTVRRDRPTPLPGQTTTGTGYSFPSGHATMTFAAATVLQQHLGYRAGIPTYLIASYVAMSRLHDNVHWASDVAFGTGLGIMIGRSVTWHGRNFYGYNVTPAPMLLPHGAGVIFVAHADPPPAPVRDR